MTYRSYRSYRLLELEVLPKMCFYDQSECSLRPMLEMGISMMEIQFCMMGIAITLGKLDIKASISVDVSKGLSFNDVMRQRGRGFTKK